MAEINRDMKKAARKGSKPEVHVIVASSASTIPISGLARRVPRRGNALPESRCSWWQGESPAALDGDVYFDGGRFAALPEKTTLMLKAAGPLRWRRARES